MSNVLMVSYVSLNIEGRLLRCYTALQNNDDIHVKLIQGASNEQELTDNVNVINVIHEEGMKGYVSFVKKTWRLIKHEKYDYLYLHDYRTAIFSRLALNDKVIYDAYELLYPGSGLKFRLREWFYYLEEKRAIKRCGICIAANRERAFVMVGKYKLHYIPMVIENIPMEINDEVRPIEEREFAIVYIGYINENNGIDGLINAVEEYNSTAKNKLTIHLYGKWMLNGSVEEYNERGVEYHGSYKLEDLNEILQQYTFGFLSYKNENLDTILCAPNKCYDYINNGNVAICNENYLMMDLTNRYNTGFGGDDLTMVIEIAVKNRKTYFDRTSDLRIGFSSNNQFVALIEYIKGTRKNTRYF